jgi:hypothetical protein
MPDDLDHEVIDSPQALFRHLYEAHGLVEALDLDPETAPLQFWLRRHAELERAAGRSAAQDRAAATPIGGGSPWRRPGNLGATPGQGAGPRFRPFADPLVEALAVALVGRGLDERQVRLGLSTFTGRGGRHGEEAVRSAFIAPVLEALAAHLTGNVGAPPPPPEPAPPERVAGGPVGRESAPRQPPGREPVAGRAKPPGREPAAGRAKAAPMRAEPSAAEREAWVAQPLAARSPVPEPEPEVDFMAIADVLQERQRSRRGGRRRASAATRSTPPGAAPRGAAEPAPSATERREPDEDYMALANALQRRRGNRPR